MNSKRLFAAAATAAAAVPFTVVVGCAQPSVPAASTVDLSSALTQYDDAINGIALADDKLHLNLNRSGLAVVDRDGALVSRVGLGEHGLENRAYHDIAVVDDGQYVLIADDAGYVYDATTEQQSLRFCVLPGGIIEDPLAQKNDALAVSGNSIVANPRFYDASDALQSSSLRTYRLTDGVPMNDVDIGTIALSGIAVGLDGIYGVHDNLVTRFDDDGAPVAEVAVDGVAHASGLAIDTAAGELFILDGTAAHVIHVDDVR